MRDGQTQLHRHFRVVQQRLQKLPQTAHRIFGRASPGEHNGAVGVQLDLMQLRDAQLDALLFEQSLSHAAHDRDPVGPLQGEAPRENVR